MRGEWITNPYHNLFHTEVVVKNARHIAKELGLDPTPFVLAAYFHDFGHHSKDDQKNIDAALIGLAKFFNESAWLLRGISYKDIEKLILATKFPYQTPPESLGEAIMRDADRLGCFRENAFHEIVIAFHVCERGLPLEEAILAQKQFIREAVFYTAPANKIAYAAQTGK